MNDTTCAVCGKTVRRVVHHFPHRRSPADQLCKSPQKSYHPFLATLYFRDPFWGKLAEEYCGPECSLIAYQAREEQDV